MSVLRWLVYLLTIPLWVVVGVALGLGLVCGVLAFAFVGGYRLALPFVDWVFDIEGSA